MFDFLLIELMNFKIEFESLFVLENDYYCKVIWV